VIQSFAIAFAFSFLGSIPPGTINLTILQLGLEKRQAVALRFALAAVLIEYPYCWIAVKFASLIMATPSIVQNLQLISGLVMVALGVLNLWSAARPTSFSMRFHNSGFRRGLILGILNPMAIPFWIAMTTYFRSQNWIDLTPKTNLHSYLTGVVFGGLTLLLLLTYLAGKIATLFTRQGLLKRIPGIVLIVLGLYALVQLLV
jgi:threonine/homoserine/homoserine lactone efflux protein